jgi:hypothetical protein
VSRLVHGLLCLLVWLLFVACYGTMPRRLGKRKCKAREIVGTRKRRAPRSPPSFALELLLLDPVLGALLVPDLIRAVISYLMPCGAHPLSLQCQLHLVCNLCIEPACPSLPAATCSECQKGCGLCAQYCAACDTWHCEVCSKVCWSQECAHCGHGSLSHPESVKSCVQCAGTATCWLCMSACQAPGCQIVGCPVCVEVCVVCSHTHCKECDCIED